jgi:hypothetical protein
VTAGREIGDAAFSASTGRTLSGRTYAGRVLPVVRYSLLRFALFTACLGILYLAGARGLLDLVLAAGVSLALSYVLLAGPRRQVSELLVERASRRAGAAFPGRFARRLAEDAAVEDAAVEDVADEDAADDRERADHGRNVGSDGEEQLSAHDQQGRAGAAEGEGASERQAES